jgi:predicted RNase H-like HicB family nuclease
MEIEGKIWKDGKFWLVEVPALDAITQGKTRKEALAMAKDLVFEMTRSYFEDEIDKNFSITVIDYKKNIIGVTASDNRLFLALSLRRQREKSGSTVREASERLGSKSPNAYAQYERGKTSISVDKYEELLTAANPSERLRLRIA